MPYYDLNVPWTSGSSLQRTIAFLDELGYNVLALSHTITGKPSNSSITCPIPAELPFKLPPRTRILRRCTLVFSDASQNYRLSELASKHDLLALRPTNEKALQLACAAQDCDIISIDLTQRMDYYPKMKTLASAVERGVTIELCYAPAIAATDYSLRRNVITNATQLIRASRGRGLIISSETPRAACCRGPEDVINLAAIWGLGQEKGKEALERLSRATVVNAQLRRTSFKGVVDIVQVAGKESTPKTEQDDQKQQSKKRKADVASVNVMPLSKREEKRRRKAELEAQQKKQAATNS